jgi:steroid delta-isomerase-like uncharacterized protein
VEEAFYEVGSLRRASILSFKPSLLTGRVLLQTVSDGKGVPCMSEQNKAHVRRLLEEAFGQGKTEVVDEVLHSEFVCYDPNSESGEIRGADTIKGEIEYFRNAVPDLSYSVEDQVVEGDKVVSRWRARGTHEGEFFGVPGSGNRIEMTGIQIDRFDESGKLIEEWPEYDLLGAMKQMGAVSEPGQEEATGAPPAAEEREEKGLMDKAKDKLMGQ